MFRKLSLLLLAALLLTACSGAGTNPSNEVRDVSLVLDWYPNAVHAFVYAAQEHGYFREEGLNVSIKMPAENPTDGIRLVGAGQETFAFYYQPDVLLARNEGIPIVSVAAIVRRPLNGIMVPASSDITSPRELEGKRVGYPGIPLNVSMVRTMVSTDGGDFSRVTMTDISWDLIPAIATERVDAVAGAFVNHEKPILERKGIPVRYFAPADFGVPNYYELVLIAGEETVQENPETVRAMLRALTRGYEWVKANPEDALKLLLAQENESFPLDPAVEEASLQMLLPWMEEEGIPFGAQRAEDWEEVAAWLTGQGMLKESLNPADAFVDLTDKE